jgi:hypothetical protein
VSKLPVLVPSCRHSVVHAQLIRVVQAAAEGESLLEVESASVSSLSCALVLACCCHLTGHGWYCTALLGWLSQGGPCGAVWTCTAAGSCILRGRARARDQSIALSLSECRLDQFCLHIVVVYCSATSMPAAPCPCVSPAHFVPLLHLVLSRNQTSLWSAALVVPSLL